MKTKKAYKMLMKLTSFSQFRVAKNKYMYIKQKSFNTVEKPVCTAQRMYFKIS